MGLYLFRGITEPSLTPILKIQDKNSWQWTISTTSYLIVTSLCGLLEYIKLLSYGDRLCPAFNIQLGINIGDMTLHGGDRYN